LFTLEIDGKPTVIFDAKNAEAASRFALDSELGRTAARMPR
jgi:hypothetical protein